jgi:hypothetical protein
VFTLIHQLSFSTWLLLLAIAAVLLGLLFLPGCRRAAPARRDLLLAGGLALKFTSSWGASFGTGVGTGMLDRVSSLSCFLIAALWIALLFRLAKLWGGRAEDGSSQVDAADDTGTSSSGKRLVGLSMMSPLADVLDFVR